MSDDPTFFGGITAEVQKVRPTGIGQAGIGFAALPCPKTGAPRLAVTLIHPDGTGLCAYLDELMVCRSADNMADFIEALPDMQSVAVH
ncbi:MAG TPA: hypothetical protein VEC11_07660 [Allosphingosinicella sp.]|nr:hypothetical protein [Allosphingosinicella sp.]